MPAQKCLKLFPRSRIFRGNLQSFKWRDFWKMCAAGDLWCGAQLSHMCSLLGEFKLLEPVFYFYLFFGFFSSVVHLTCVIWSVVWEIEKKTWCLKSRNYPTIINYYYYWNINYNNAEFWWSKNVYCSCTPSSTHLQMGLAQINFQKELKQP